MITSVKKQKRAKRAEDATAGASSLKRVSSSLPTRLRQSCDRHPHAKIPWSHRLLHEAADEIERLQSIINRASVKFCDDGSDGEIAAGMFAILGEKNTPNAPHELPPTNTP